MATLKVRQGGTWVPVLAAGVTPDQLDDEIANLARKIYFDPRDYGTISTLDAQADNNMSTLAATAVAADAVNGTIVLPPQRIPISDNVAIPSHVGMIGAGKFATRFEAVHADAQVTFTDPSDSRIADFVFDGNDLATAGLIVLGVAGVNQMIMEHVGSTNVVGRAASFHNVQNSSIIGLATNYSDIGIAVDDGCGSIQFTAPQSASNEVANLWMGKTGLVAAGYNEPTQILFDTAMLEFYGAATGSTIASVAIEAAVDVVFRNCRLLGPPAIDMSVAGAGVTQSTIYLDRTVVWGDTTCITMDGNSNIIVDSPSHMFSSTPGSTGIVGTGATPSIRHAKLLTWQNITTKLSGVIQTETTSHHGPYVDRPLVSDGQFLRRVGLTADTGFRYFEDYGGTLGWANGTVNAADTTLGRAAAHVLSMGSDDGFKTGVFTTAARNTWGAAAAGNGTQIYDETLDKPIWSDGTNWRDAAGTVV